MNPSEWKFIWELVSAAFIGALPPVIYMKICEINRKDLGMFWIFFWILFGFTIVGFILKSYGWFDVQGQ